MGVQESELFEEGADFFNYFFVVLVLIFRVDHKLLEEIFDLDIFAEAETVRIEVELYILLGEEPGDGNHLRL